MLNLHDLRTKKINAVCCLKFYKLMIYETNIDCNQFFGFGIGFMTYKSITNRKYKEQPDQRK